MASVSSHSTGRAHDDRAALPMGGEEGSLPVVAEEDDLNWGRQSTLPAMATPVRAAAGNTAGPAGGAGENGGPPAREEDEAVLRSQWNRQSTAPVQRPFAQAPDAQAGAPKGGGGGGGGGGGFGGGRGSRGGGGGGAGGAVWFYKDWSGEHGPRSLYQLTQALQKGYFTPALEVRKQGQDKWHSLKDVLDMRQAMKARRAASFKEEAQRRRGGGQGKQGSPPGGQQQRNGQQTSAAQTPNGASTSPQSAPLSPGQISNALISQLFRPGGPDWYYVDMQGAVQGPFKSGRMAKWWANPQYRDHFSTLRCRRGLHGPFQLLSEFSQQQQNDASSAAVSPQPSTTERAPPSKQILEQQKATQQASEKAQAAEEQVKQLLQRVEELELENEQLRQGNEDTFMLRMQVEQLCRDKASLAAEVSQLKRDKEGLQELLQYAQQFEAREEELLGDEIDLDDETAAAGTSAAEDEATQLWLEELRKTQVKEPGIATRTPDA